MEVSRRSMTLGSLCGALAIVGGVRPVRADISDPQHLNAPGLDLGAMDRSVVPGDDFYRYVSGDWLRTTRIPSDRGRWAEIDRLDNLNAARNRDILETAARAPGDAESEKLGAFYASLMEEAAIEARGAAPLRAELARIAAIADPTALARALSQVARDALPLLGGGGGPMPPSPISASVQIDDKNPARYLPSLSQGGIGLPDRDYFLVDNPGFVKARAAYRAHLAAMFTLAGLEQAETRAARVYGLEEQLAHSQWSKEALRDAEKRYNLMSGADLRAAAPGLDWQAFLGAAGFGGETTFLVTTPSAVVGAAQLVRTGPLDAWKDYLAYRAIQAFAPAGPKAFVDETFVFEGKAILGAAEPPPRWKRAVGLVDRSMGHAVGRLYMASYFTPAARREAERMTLQIKAAMGRRIKALDWMTPATKAGALAKLEAVRIEIGGQQPLRTYERLPVSRVEPYANLLSAARFLYDLNLSRLGNPVDRGEWQMLPQTVNAQSNFKLTKIMFPAGIIQGLFFNPAADAAVNYGAIGVMMGHELSHQFDDQGAKYDASGALRNWWSPEDLKAFSRGAAALAAQYDRYEPLPGMHINGHLTLGENLADLAGLAVARDAYYASLDGNPPPVIAGLTADQRFYIAFNSIFRAVSTEAFMRRALATDPHSPGEWRAAEVRNLDAWYSAFDVRPGQRMYLAPDERVKVW